MAHSTAHSDAVDAIGRSIVQGVHAPGDVMKLEELQHDYGISRTVAREVMRVLESMNLIESRRRVGLIVQDPGLWPVFDPRVLRWRLAGSDRETQLRWMTELRVAVEPWAANLAASADSPAGAELVRVARQMRVYGEAGDLQTFLELDREYHDLLLHASGNQLFAALSEVIGEVLAGRTHLGLMPHQPVAEALQLHEDVARAILERDPLAAMQGMSDLLAEVRTALFVTAPEAAASPAAGLAHGPRASL
ncbi:MAG: FadR/GntR family transcriptional regulator [Protaetiibacter sp.]